MALVSRLLNSTGLASVVMATAVGLAALIPMPASAHDDDDDLVRVIVDVADVIFRGGYPYYRYGGYGDHLVIVHDRYGHPTYYRQVPRRYYYSHYRPPYGNAYGYWARHPAYRYDRRYDNRYYGHDGYRHGRRDDDDRRWDGHHRRDRD